MTTEILKQMENTTVMKPDIQCRQESPGKTIIDDQPHHADNNVGMQILSAKENREHKAQADNNEEAKNLYEANTNHSLKIDIDLSMDSAGKSIRDEDDDDISIASSTASSVHEMITYEMKRKEDRKSKIRERLRRLTSRRRSNGDDQSFASFSSDCSSRSSDAVGIMTARTLEESLEGGRVVEMRKLRRKITIKFKNPSTSKASESDSVTLSEDLSMSESSGLSSSVKSSSLDEISLGFSKVYIQEYIVVPGVNPSCTSGPPVELGWAHSELREIDFERYERTRHGKRRFKMQMRMPNRIRKELLLFHGSTEKMIKKATKAANNSPHKWWWV